MFFRIRKQVVIRAIDFAPTIISWLKKERDWAYSLDDYRRMPEGSLGKSVADYLDARQFDFIYDSYHHDIRHVLLGYDMNTTGEIRLQAFMVGNNWLWNYKGWMAFLLGVVLLPELWGTLYRDFKRGKRTQNLKDIPWVHQLHQPIHQLRRQLNIPPMHIELDIDYLSSLTE